MTKQENVRNASHILTIVKPVKQRAIVMAVLIHILLKLELAVSVAQLVLLVTLQRDV